MRSLRGFAEVAPRDRGFRLTQALARSALQRRAITILGAADALSGAMTRGRIGKADAVDHLAALVVTTIGRGCFRLDGTRRSSRRAHQTEIERGSTAPPVIVSRSVL